MLTRRMASVILLIGGCTKKEEGGALRSIEELSFRENSDGIDVKSRVVGELQEPRRSPAVFAEKDGFLVVGGCQEKGVHARSAERLLWSRDSLVSNGSFFHDVVEATSCAASFKLDVCDRDILFLLCRSTTRYLEFRSPSAKSTPYGVEVIAAPCFSLLFERERETKMRCGQVDEFLQTL
ncbi:hypothetical protein GCK32_015724 [Trichostrongylus colubriformis]|uniref:Lipoprotein n=1 Tax=Trichostrongylus colubriformis TaxID=6319 RepID=A0AAN8IKE5_TRICO